jgi:hypothetical protein
VGGVVWDCIEGDEEQPRPRGLSDSNHTRTRLWRPHASHKAIHRYPPVNHPQGLHKPRHRILQVCSKHVGNVRRSPLPKMKSSPLRRILFQRGVYPADDFHMVKKYGQTVLITQDLALENYLEKYLLLSYRPSPENLTPFPGY